MIRESFSANNKMGIGYHVEPHHDPSLFELKDTYLLRQVVIWGNGPNASDTAKSKVWEPNAGHIGTNMAGLLDGITFDAYCVGDARFFDREDKREMAENAQGVRVYQNTVRHRMPVGGETNYIKTIGRDGFCSDLEEGIYHGYSVVWFALQVAVWMGSKDILLAGCPHDYSKGFRFYEESEPSGVDKFTARILHNYTKLLPVLQKHGIRLRVIDDSTLENAGLGKITLDGHHV